MVNKNEGRSRCNAYLPQELVTQVLLRLPVVSLLRFKCVCKDWYTMINDPQFAKAQLRQAKHASGLICELFKLDCKNTVILSYFDVEEENGGGAQIDFSVEKLDVILKDSCNGLLLLLHLGSSNSATQFSVWNPITKLNLKLPQFHTGNQFFVWNPITKWNLKLPQFHTGNHVQELCSSLVYDDSNQKYKVVITLRRSEIIFQSSYECWVFTLGEKEGGGGAAAGDGRSSCGRWRELDMPAAYRISRCKPLSANGALHWIVRRISEAEVDEYILLMDLASEEFRVISPPQTSTSYYRADLLKMKDSLCLSYKISMDEVNLWVLNDPVKQVWNKQYSIDLGLFMGNCLGDDDSWFDPVLVMENSSPVIIFDISSEFMEGLFGYNLDNGQFKEVHKGIGNRNSGVFLHVNSLINC